jgi:hypothetical protein
MASTITMLSTIASLARDITVALDSGAAQVLRWCAGSRSVLRLFMGRPFLYSVGALGERGGVFLIGESRRPGRQ